MDDPGFCKEVYIPHFFSNEALDKLVPVIRGIVEHAADIMRQRHEKGTHVNVQKLYPWIVVDITSMALFGHTQDLTAKDENDIYPDFLTSIDMFTNHMWLTKHFSILNRIALSLPLSFAEKVASGYAIFGSQCAEWIHNIKARREKGITQTGDGRDTVFGFLLEPNPDKYYEVPTIEQLVDEAFFHLVAGSDTTAYTAAWATYCLLTHKQPLTKLMEKLKHIPRSLNSHWDLTDFMRLLYPTAVVKESLRLASNIAGILPGVVPPQDALVKKNFIPGGANVSMSTRTIHDNPDPFPEPGFFKPERWLGEKGKELEK